MKRLSFLFVTLFAAVLFLVSAGCASTNAPAEQREKPEKEQVNIGYGTQDADAITGAVSMIRAGDRQITSGRAEEMIEGRIAGVHVYRTSRGNLAVQVRGISTFYGDNQPLYVVDGVSLLPSPDGGVPGINPWDIDNIVVLKDAGSAAIYGSRAAHGVVLITTKRGN